MKRYLIILILLLLVAGLIVWFWPSKSIVGPISEAAKSEQSQSAASVASSSTPAQPSGEKKVQQPGGLYESSDSRWNWWNEMNKKDPQFEWKMPINFYGKVVEYTTGQPIAGVEVTLAWNDLSKEGTSQAVVYSDAQGLFKVTEKSGKILSISELKKEGYVRSRIGAQSTFEYAAFFEKNYYEPDQNNPIVFRMRKQSEAERLAHRQSEIIVGVGRVGVVQLDPQTVIQVELLANGEISTKNWSARVSVPGGGIQTSTEEFPFSAPENGYHSSLILDLETPKPGNWTGMYQGGQFYVKTANGQYGRIELKTVSGKTFMRYSFFLNPSGSRNLEFDPTKRVNP